MKRNVSGFDIEAMKSEFAGAALPDERLVPRLETFVELLSGDPAASFSQMSRTEAEREGAYRFLRNSRIEASELLVPHQRATAKRAKKAKHILAIHDTTEVRIADDAELDSWLQRKRRGFIAHASLLAARGGAPLGLGAIETIERKSGPSRTRNNGRRLRGDETARLENKEYDRWARGVTKVADLIGPDLDVIHVMDAEADSYALLASMSEGRHQFVVRLCQNRVARSVRTDEWSRIRDLLAKGKEFKRTRSVHISKRTARRAPSAARAKPSRDARDVELTLSFTRVVIRRPSYVQDLPDQLELTAVRALEKNPPEGTKPIDWILLTNLAVDSKAGVEVVIDIYRQRWLIEEWFKALKTGCGFRKRKLTNPNSIYNSLALLIPFAWRALMLRELSRQAAPATSVFTRIELRALRAYAKKLKKKLPARLTANDALYFLAETGGYRPSKKSPPGWATLINGLQRFDAIVQGWILASEM